MTGRSPGLARSLLWVTRMALVWWLVCSSRTCSIRSSLATRARSARSSASNWANSLRDNAGGHPARLALRRAVSSVRAARFSAGSQPPKWLAANRTGLQGCRGAPPPMWRVRDGSEADVRPGQLGKLLRRTIRPGGGEVAVQHAVERLRVHRLQDTGDGPGTRGPDPPGERVAPAAQSGQGGLVAAGGPFADRVRGLVPGRGVGAHRHPQHGPSRCQRRDSDRGSGTRDHHSTKQTRAASSSATDSDNSPKVTSIGEDSDTGTAFRRSV